MIQLFLKYFNEMLYHSIAPEKLYIILSGNQAVGWISGLGGNFIQIGIYPKD